MSAAKSTLGRTLRRVVESVQVQALSDRELLQRYTTGRDEAAFAVLVRRHAPRVLAACRQVLSDPADLEDAFQATFLVLLDKAKRVRWQDDFGGWLGAVAHRVAVRTRSLARHRRRHEAKAPAPIDGDSGDDLSWREACELLHDELDRLPDKFRRPLLLCYLEGKSRDEAAVELSLTVAAVKSRLERGRNELRARLQRRGVTLTVGLLAALAIPRADAAPDRLIQSTLSAASGTASARVTGLVRTVTAAMTLSKLSLAAGLLLLAGLLGTVLPLGRPSNVTASPTPPAAGFVLADPKPSGEVEVSGRVLDSEGTPLGGAVVYLWANKKAGPETKADAKGAFRLTVPAERSGEGAILVASAEGHGPEWLSVTAEKKEVTLRLPKDDLPITGRVLDLEGRPVVGATVEVQSLRKPGEKDLDAWLEWQKGGRYIELPRIAGEALRATTKLTTDKQGRFSAVGFGRERVLGLLIRGSGIRQTQVWAVTRAEVPKELRRGNFGTYPANFDLLIGPSRAIVGTVRDKATGKPIAGVTVSSFLYGSVTAKTDEQGRYRIEGVGKHERYDISAGGKLPYFNCTQMKIPDREGLEPITVDFELEKGLVIRGKLTDKETGKPVRGSVTYAPFPDNPHLKDFTDISKPQAFVDDPFRVKPDGTFQALAIPGSGALCVQAEQADRYVRKVPEKLNLGNLILETYHAIIPVDVSEKDPKSLVCDIALEPGRALAGTLVDADGKPVTGVHAFGLSATAEVHFGTRRSPLEKAEFRVGGLGDQPRVLFFFHPERKLSRLLTVNKDDKEPLTVRLEAPGSLSGRLLAGDKPQAGVKVAAVPTHDFKQYGKELPIELQFDYPAWSKLLRAEATTDEKGNFRLDGLLPGMKYTLMVDENKKLTGEKQDGLAVESGKVTAVGDFTTPR